MEVIPSFYVASKKNYRQYCHVGNTAHLCRQGLIQDSVFAGELEDSNQPQKESYVSLEAEHVFPLVGCARSKRQYPTVLQSLKSFLWMLDCAWMDCLLSIFGTW